MQIVSLEQELKENNYPGRGIVIGKTKDGKRLQLLILLWAEAKTVETVCLWKKAKAFAHRHSIPQN